MGRVAEYIERKYGVKTRILINPETDTLSTTPQRILKLNPDRFAFTLINLSADVIYIAPFKEVSSTKGIRLDANGGSITILAEEDFELQTYEWWGVSTGASSPILLIEVIGE